MLNIENVFFEKRETEASVESGDLHFHISSSEELALAIQGENPRE